MEVTEERREFNNMCKMVDEFKKNYKEKDYDDKNSKI
jgi:hypothetical protein